LDRVGLADLGQHLPSELSGGEQQRVAIARALANDPRLLLADEPTGNLDSVTGESIVELFGELSAAGATIVMVTHDQSVAQRASRIVSMQDGKIIGDRRRPPSPEQSFAAVRHGRADAAV
jgi:putative ABC transport system ATP-binding protein